MRNGPVVRHIRDVAIMRCRAAVKDDEVLDTCQCLRLLLLCVRCACHPIQCPARKEEVRSVSRFGSSISKVIEFNYGKGRCTCNNTCSTRGLYCLDDQTATKSSQLHNRGRGLLFCLQSFFISWKVVQVFVVVLFSALLLEFAAIAEIDNLKMLAACSHVHAES